MEPVGRLGHLVERGVHEHAGQLGLAPERGADLLGRLRLARAAGCPGQKIMPSAHAPSDAARRASSSSVMPQILTLVTTP